jgi:(E)-4-hydroxy-3-methylbut-2-enyl-diphosphate synthase
VSLTEDSVYEIPAAYAIVKPYNQRLASPDTAPTFPVRIATSTAPVPQETRNPYGYRRRASDEVTLGDLQIGGAQPVRVELATTVPLADVDGTLAQIQALCTPATPGAPVCEMVRLQAQSSADLAAFAQLRQRLPEAGVQVPLALCLPAALLASVTTLPEAAKLVTAPDPTLANGAWHDQVRQVVALVARHGMGLEWAIRPETIPTFLRASYGSTLEGLAYTASALVELARAGALPGAIVSCEVAQPVAAYRFLAAHLEARGLAVPLHLKTPPLTGRNAALFQASLWLGTLLSDGLGDSLQIDSDLPAAEAINLSYNILQAARLRMSKTEFISCPSCGRTLFNLQTTTERIKTRMSHLKEVKIAIMGCIVNGPGEMADADFGYVGSGPGRISLYVGKECVERNLPQEQADERLIQLIQTHGKWVDPVVEQ